MPRLFAARPADDLEMTIIWEWGVSYIGRARKIDVSLHVCASGSLRHCCNFMQQSANAAKRRGV